jgi:potassium-transporting ATPase KdpC subunit
MNMSRYICRSVLLLTFCVVIYYGLYPLSSRVIGQAILPFQANGRILTGSDGKVAGSRQIAQPLKDENSQPHQVASTLGPIVKYKSGPKAGHLVAPDIEAWFQQDKYSGNPDTVAQWADAHDSAAQAWVNADPTHRRNRDFGAAETPLLQHPRTVCHFYDC